MKITSIPSLACFGTLMLCAGNALALSPFAEKFAADPNSSRWGTSNFGSGEIAVSGGKLSFSVAKNPTRDDFATLTLKSPLPKVTEDWEVTVDVTNTSAKGNSSSPGLLIENAADRNDAVFIEFYNNSPQSSQVGSIFMTNENDDPDQDIGKSITGTKASLRASYKKSTKLITLWYRTSSKVAWSKLANFSPFNDATAQRYGNWKMNATTGKFRVTIYGFAEKSVIPSGTITLDNFSIR